MPEESEPVSDLPSAPDTGEDPESEASAPSRMPVSATRIFGLLGILALIALLLDSLGVAYVTTASPGCESCHLVGDWAQETQEASHRSVECQACHPGRALLPRVVFASRVVNSMVLGIVPSPGRPGSNVSDATCLKCHSKILGKLTDSKGFRIAHVSCATDRSCIECHSTVAHGSASSWARTSEMAVCIACHEETSVSTECDACHAGRSESERIGQGAWRVTHGQNWQAAHGMGDVTTCVSCHPDDYCVRCHGISLPHDQEFVRQHSEFSLQPGARCTECHQSAFCSDCHGIEMPHPDGFIAEHATVADGMDDVACAACHAPSDCMNCHVLHVHPGLPQSLIESLKRGR